MGNDVEAKNPVSGKHWIIVLIILVTGYGIYSGVSDLRNSHKGKWSKESKQILVDKCIEDSKDMAEKYPQLTKEYCICSTEKIQNEFTKEEYIEISKKSIKEQTEKLLPSFKNCLNLYQAEIKELNNFSKKENSNN